MNRHLKYLILAAFLFSVGCQQDTANESQQNDSRLPVNTPTVTDITDGQTLTRDEPAFREFTFVYGGAISELKPGAEVSIWLPIAEDTHEQEVLDREINVPGEYVIGEEAKFGNTILHFKATANNDGEVPYEVTYIISRKEALRDQGEALSDGETELFQQATSFVPIDKELSADVLGDTELADDALIAGRQIYDAINERMQYDKPEGKAWGRGDSVWACGNGFGNCTDFHSLFISVCREQDIAARFEIGFPIPSKTGAGEVGGYHCWAKFAADNKWMPVDISEADKAPTLTDYYYGNLTANRVTFTIGRDLTLTPEQQAGPVNFLVYPYAEVEGEAHTTFRKGFRYEDIR